MIKLGKRRPEVPVPHFPDPQAQVDVVEGNAQSFIQPADFVVNRRPHHYTSSGNGTQRLRQPRPMIVAGVTTPRPRIRVTGNAADYQHDAAMLDGGVREVEHCADAPDLPQQVMDHYLRHTVRGYP